jgi:hypothetical protein
VQHLVALTSTYDPLFRESGWYKNAAGFCVHEGFGFGMLDAKALIMAADPQTFVHVPSQHKCEIATDAKSNLPQ